MGLILDVQMSNCSYHINIIVGVMDSGLYWARHLMCFLAGNLVKNASFGKLKIGTARGGVPATRIAVYKLVLGSLCYGFMTRAFTAAIEDKVDILNLSIGHPNDDEKIKMRESDYFDEIELGTYKDMFHDMLSCTAAGNDSATTKNVAPWTLCVAASNSPKTFTPKILVGHSNFSQKEGFSINRFGDTESCSLIYSKNARAPIGAVGILDPQKVKRKIVVYAINTNGMSALKAGAAGVIIIGKGNDTPRSLIFSLSMACVTKEDVT
ncbi:unnamed protein product [Camellia sinensis]